MSIDVTPSTPGPGGAREQSDQQWRPIPGFPRYLISPAGRIKRVNRIDRAAKTPATHDVKAFVCLQVRGRRVHVGVEDLLVAAFGEVP